MKLRQKIRKTLIYLAAIIFPITMFYYSPYVIIHAATESVICGSFILFAFMLIFKYVLPILIPVIIVYLIYILFFDRR